MSYLRYIFFPGLFLFLFLLIYGGLWFWGWGLRLGFWGFGASVVGPSGFVGFRLSI